MVAAVAVRPAPGGPRPLADGCCRRTRRQRRADHTPGRDAHGPRPPGTHPRCQRERRRARHAPHRAQPGAVGPMSDDQRLLYLEPDEEITSVVRRLRETGATRVVLVVPGRSRATASAVGLRLLASFAAEAGRDLALVADASTRALAAEAEIAVFDTVADVSAGTVSAEAPGPPRAPIHIVRGAGSTSAAAAPAPASAEAA